MKSKAFTLIELLAVMVIIGIIMMITVPIIGDIIGRNRYEAYKLSEKTLGEAAKNYYAVNSDQNPDALDENKLSALFLLSSEYIKMIYDPKSKEECYLNESYVKIIRDENNNLEYIPVLMCPNYFNLANINSIRDYLDLNTDDDLDGLANGFVTGGNTGNWVTTLATGEQEITWGSSTGGINLYALMGSPSQGDIIYLSADYKGNGNLDLGESLEPEYIVDGIQINTTTEWQTYSDLSLVTNESNKVYFIDVTLNEGDTVYIKNIIFVNFSDLYPPSIAAELTIDKVRFMIAEYQKYH